MKRIEKIKFLLGKGARIRGKLHLEGIRSAIINNKPYFESMKKIYDEGGIINFEITKKSVLLAIDWVNFPPNKKINEFSLLRSKLKKSGGKIVPDLNTLS